MDAVMGTDWYKSNLAAILVNIAIPSLLIWLVGRKLNSTPDVKVIDPMTKDSVDARPNHSLWGISMEYWGLIGMAFFSTIEIYRWFR